LDPEVAAELPVVSFDVALPSVGKLEVPLDKYIPLIAVRGLWPCDSSRAIMEIFP
jgi:hypothetical protein